MSTKWKRVRGAVGMGLTWAVGWALVGGLIELITNFVPGWNGAVIDMWPQALAVPGFLGGGAFSVVLGIAGGRRRFDELSMAGFVLWGALGGALVSAAVLAGLGVTIPTLVAAGVIIGLCTGSAAATLALARRSEDQELLEAGEAVAQVGLSESEARALLGGRSPHRSSLKATE